MKKIKRNQSIQLIQKKAGKKGNNYQLGYTENKHQDDKYQFNLNLTLSITTLNRNRLNIPIKRIFKAQWQRSSGWILKGRPNYMIPARNTL